MPTFRGVVRLTHPALGGTGTNTWHARTSGPIPGAEADLEALTGLIGEFYMNISSVLHQDANVVFDGVWTEVGGPGEQTVEGATFEWPGLGTGKVLPPANCIVVGWRAQTGGRSGRGRTFLGPLSETVAQDNGTIAEAPLDDLRVAGNQLVQASKGFDNGAVGIWSPTDQLFRDFEQVRVRDVFAVLRSRRD